MLPTPNPTPLYIIYHPAYDELHHFIRAQLEQEDSHHHGPQKVALVSHFHFIISIFVEVAMGMGGIQGLLS